MTMLEVKNFPKDMSVFEVNRADAKQCFLSGLFEETVKLESGIRSFYTYLKPDGDSSPTVASTSRLFNYINQNKFNPQTFKYMPDELLPVSKTPFAWVLFDRFEPIKESAGK